MISTRETKQVTAPAAVRQSTGLSLPRNLAWTLAGNLLYIAAQWGILMILAKIGSPEMVGQLALGLAITAPVFMFANLHLRAVQATDARGEYMFGDYLRLRLLTIACAVLLIAAILPFQVHRRETALVVFMVAIAKAFESGSDTFYGLLQRNERMDQIAISMMIRGALSLVAAGFCIFATGRTVWGAAGMACAWGVTLLIYDIPAGAAILRHRTGQMDSLRPRWQMQRLRKLAWLTLPLGLAAMLSSLHANIPRYFIERYGGERELGVFAALSYLAMAGTPAVAALAESATPRLAKYYSSHRLPDFQRLFRNLLLIACGMGFLGIMVSVYAGGQILNLFYRSEYRAYGTLLVVLTGAAAIMYVASLLNYALVAVRYFRTNMALLCLVTAGTVLGCMWLVPSRGLQGAALAVVGAALVQAIGGWLGVAHALQKAREY